MRDLLHVCFLANPLADLDAQAEKVAGDLGGDEGPKPRGQPGISFGAEAPCRVVSSRRI